jgi:hypothetical protein
MRVLRKLGAVIRRSLAAEVQVQFDMIYLLTAIGLAPGGRSTVHIYTQTPSSSSTVHIYTKTIHRTSQNKQYIEQHKNFGRVRVAPVLASYTLAFALQLRKKHEKTSVRVAEQ